MAQFSYDVVPHKGGWAILVTLGEADAFPTRQAAYDVAVELARKLRFAGFAFNVQVDRAPPKKAAGAQ
ncbi:MAG: hypothetical protein K2Y71_03000 [Xanthobacteraceae bacterium]|nr:hypothetical protein [Xanthobacteraceae bacterium]